MMSGRSNSQTQNSIMKTTHVSVSIRKQIGGFAALGMILAGMFAGLAAVQAGDTVPWKSASIGQVTITESGMVITEAGHAAHLGTFTKQSDLVTAGYTAANGDTLEAVITGVVDNFPVMEIQVMFVEGTGRFDGATGGYVATILIDPIPLSVDPLSFAFRSTATGTLSTVGSTKSHPVQRPDAWKGLATIQANLSGAWVEDDHFIVPWRIVEENGQATHCGRYTSHGSGFMVHDLNFEPIGLTGEGWLVAANGDVIYWHQEQEGENPTMLWFHGGTGRFENAIGEAVAQMVILSESSDEAGTILTIKVAVSGAGWISY
jgi:hypothetical protein